MFVVALLFANVDPVSEYWASINCMNYRSFLTTVHRSVCRTTSANLSDLNPCIPTLSENVESLIYTDIVSPLVLNAPLISIKLMSFVDIFVKLQFSITMSPYLIASFMANAFESRNMLFVILEDTSLTSLNSIFAHDSQVIDSKIESEISTYNGGSVDCQ